MVGNNLRDSNNLFVCISGFSDFIPLFPLRINPPRTSILYGSPGGTILLISYHLLLITYHLLLITYHLLLTTYYLSYHFSPL